MADSQRKTIKVVSVGTTREVGEKGAKVTPFKGGDGVVYEVWSDTLLEYVKVDAELEVDVVYSESKGKDPEGTIYPHHKVTQIYVEGKPIQVRSFRQGGQGKSPEERASIEAQTAANIVSHLLIAGKLDHDSPLVVSMKEWCRQKLSSPPPPTEEQKVTVKKEPPVEFHPEKRHFISLAAFLVACNNELGLDHDAVRLETNTPDLREITDYAKAWVECLRARKKGGQNPP